MSAPPPPSAPPSAGAAPSEPARTSAAGSCPSQAGSLAGELLRGTQELRASVVSNIITKGLVGLGVGVGLAVFVFKRNHHLGSIGPDHDFISPTPHIFPCRQSGADNVYHGLWSGYGVFRGLANGSRPSRGSTSPGPRQSRNGCHQASIPPSGAAGISPRVGSLHLENKLESSSHSKRGRSMVASLSDLGPSFASTPTTPASPR